MYVEHNKLNSNFVDGKSFWGNKKLKNFKFKMFFFLQKIIYNISLYVLYKMLMLYEKNSSNNIYNMFGIIKFCFLFREVLLKGIIYFIY